MLVVALPGAVQGQEGCLLGDGGRNDVVNRTLPRVGTITYIGGPHFVCDGTIEIFADSAVYYEERRMSHLIGDVRFFEEARELRAAEARYFTAEGRLQAQGDVVLVDEEQGSRIENGDLVYLPETDFRDMASVTVTREADGTRPRAMLTPPRPASSDTAVALPVDSAVTSPDVAVTPPDTVEVAPPGPAAGDVPTGAPPPEPYTVVGDRIYMEGSGYFTASGDVEIVRDSLYAFADSAEYDESGGTLILEGSARVDGATYELTGRRITMTDPGGSSSRVRAEREARLTGEDVLLTSAQITVVLLNGALDRLVATPLARPGRAGPTPSMGDRAPRSGRPSPEEAADTADAAADSLALQRPEAFVQDFVLTADSLEVSAPGERIQRVFAAGSARSVSTARDSLNVDVLPEAARNDWLEGDTVVIRFPGAPPVPPLAVPDADTLASEMPLIPETQPRPGDSMVEGRPAGADTVPAMARQPADTPGETPTPPTDTTSVLVADTASPAELPVDTVTGAVLAATDTTPDPESAPDPEAGAPSPDSLLRSADGDEETDPEEIIARGRARSLYRLPPDDSTFRAGSDAPAVHYVVGQEIRIRLDAGEVDEMRVMGQTRGVHLEPLRRATADSTTAGDSIPPADAGMALPDTGMALPDTGMALPDTEMAVPDTGMAVPDTGMAVPDTGIVLSHDGTAPLDAGRRCGTVVRTTASSSTDTTRSRRTRAR